MEIFIAHTLILNGNGTQKIEENIRRVYNDSVNTLKQTRKKKIL